MNGAMSEFADPATFQATRKSLQHLQKCLMALEKIRSIVGADSPAGQLATQAIQGQWAPGGTDD